jgi:hypothetical protein
MGCLEIARKLYTSLYPAEINMKRIWIALGLVTAGALVAPARAVPPTVSPSPGYDRRLQESRGDSGTTIYTPAPRPPKQKKKPPPQ